MADDPLKITYTNKNGLFLDGITRRKPSDSHTQPKYSLESKQPAHTKLPEASLGSTRQAEKSHTLLRSIVKKPAGHRNIIESTPKNEPKIATSKDALARRSPAIRQIRARSTMRSTNIARFNHVNRQKPRILNNLGVTTEPKPKATVCAVAPSIPVAGTNGPVKQQVFNHPNALAYSHLFKKVPKQKFYHRVARALKVSTKTLAITSAIIATLSLGAFLAYQKVPSVAMRVAASKAGFGGHIPSNVPAGFSYKGPITYTKGEIALNYKSNSDNRRFEVIQKPTEWNSESLLTNYLMGSKLQYQTYSDSGLTVYVFNGGEATWVDKGIWYSIKGEGALSFDQILSIASSM